MSNIAKLHPSLPAPVIHQSMLSTSNSKSHVLAGVQDAYWSDEEADEAECPLCLEEMDVSDLNFKPCPCGYQVCRFCWHHIKENLNGRCPACRREYSDEAVQFKPVGKEDHKRLTQQKKQRDRERKELDALNRRHLLNVRVVQRNVVYVVGLGSRFAKEELIPTLRSSEYFGQYGKISKILLVKRTPPGGRAPVVGLYITYYRREDAARAITAVDGSPSPGGGRDVMRASFGTTKYCMAFLRNQNCTNNGCMDLHEWGDEKDCFTKEDLTTLKHTMKDTENQQLGKSYGGKGSDDGGLPRSAGWGQRGSASANSSRDKDGTHRTGRRGGRSNRPLTASSDSRTPTGSAKSQVERRGASTNKTPSQASSSRPSTPAPAAAVARRATSPSVSPAKPALVPKESVPQPPRSPTSSIAVESDLGSQEARSSSPSVVLQTNLTSQPPPGIPAVPPGLRSPLTPSAASSPALVARELPNTTYQMSTQAQALLDDVRARRESLVNMSADSPFPDFDRTLQNLTSGEEGFSGFKFTLDPKLAGKHSEDVALPDVDNEVVELFHPGGFDSYPGFGSPAQQSPLTSFMAPPGLSVPSKSSRLFESPVIGSPSLERQLTSGSTYTGSFNPFAESNDNASISNSARPSSSIGDDSDRRISRFGFARERQNSGLSAASSPLQSADTSLHSEHLGSSTSSYTPWPFQRNHDYGPPPGIPLRTSTPSSLRNSPLASYTAPQASFPAQQSRFQPFDPQPVDVSLKDMLGIGQDRAGDLRGAPSEQPSTSHMFNTNQFQDPAIMSSMQYDSSGVSFDALQTPALTTDGLSHQFPYPSPSLVSTAHSSQSMSSHYGVATFRGNRMNSYPLEGYDGSLVANQHSTPPPESPVLSPADFPALPTHSVDTTVRPEQPPKPYILPSAKDESTQTKAERKAAAKAAAAADKAIDKERLAKEKIEKVKAAKEKAAKVAKDKAEEKERVAKEKAVVRELAKEKEKEKVKVTQVEKIINVSNSSEAGGKSRSKQAAEANPITKTSSRASSNKASNSTAIAEAEQAPIVSRMTKKVKPIIKPIKIPKEDEATTDANQDSSAALAGSMELPPVTATAENKSTSISHIVSAVSPTDDGSTKSANIPTPATKRKDIERLLFEISQSNSYTDLSKHPFFDLSKINPATKMPLEYGPLVHALSALSVGGGSFANNMPAGSIDNAVSSFQQLLETLTQTISDLLRLLPRTTWDDSSSFDGVLRDMLKGDDFLDETGDDGKGRDDEVAALTLALERRARWMEVQLAKLEELHRDINTAAVRAVLAFNDRGWDARGTLPRVGGTLSRFDKLAMTEVDGKLQQMTIAEMENMLVVVKDAAAIAEAQLTEDMQNNRSFKPEANRYFD